MKVEGIKSPIAARTMRPRVSRHGKLLADVYTVLVPEVSETRTVLNKDTNEYETVKVIKVEQHFRPMTPTEIAESRNSVLRATDPTTSGGVKNEAPNKKVKVKA